MKILLDTNVLLDVFLERQPFYDSSTRVMILIEQGKLEGWICGTTVTTIYYLIKKALSAADADRHIKSLLKLFFVAPINHSVLTSAVDVSFRDYEDGVLHQSALAAGLDGIITRNIKDFQHSQLPIYTPDELLSALQTDE
ncbi:PIN domain-containing protein [Pleurocapsales cyanobacterium LEGE 10410]|nr:PIN domain-containing protein [Pleurocapsales cyanobacterium LEGE 10410]